MVAVTAKDALVDGSRLLGYPLLAVIACGILFVSGASFRPDQLDSGGNRPCLDARIPA
jgi:hypothetical protein